MSRRIAIVGAGIGGLHAAIALAQRGCSVVVLERAPALNEVGAGIQISPNGARLLDRIGVLEAVRAASVAPPFAELRLGDTGGLVLRLTMGQAAEARWGGPYLNIHRADLLAILAEAAQAAGVEVRTGVKIVGASDAGATTSEGALIAADATIGADGARSTVRDLLFGSTAPRFTGAVAWRATVPAEAVAKSLVPDGACVWMGPGRHLVTYRLRAGELFNLVAVEERAAWTGVGWSQPGDPDELRAAFRGWRVAPLLDAIDGCFLWGLFDRPPLARWSRGSVALLGDACHPMLPYMAQGAVQAIEDGAAIARLLPNASDIPAALQIYQEARAPRATRVQRTARENGRLYHAHGRIERAARYAVIGLGSRLAPSVAASRLDWLYGFTEPA